MCGHCAGELEGAIPFVFAQPSIHNKRDHFPCRQHRHCHSAARKNGANAKVVCVSITQNRKGSLAQHNMRSFGHCWRGVPAVPPVNLSIGLVHQPHLMRRANVTTRHQERVDPTRCKLPPVKRRKRSLRTSQRASGLLCRHQCAQRARLSAVVQMHSCVSATCGLQIDASRCVHKYMGGQE